MTAIDRFHETAMLAGDASLSFSAIRRAVWAGVDFLLLITGSNPARQHSFRNEMGYGTSEPWGVWVRSHLNSMRSAVATRL
jgi:hypothetical protein